MKFQSLKPQDVEVGDIYLVATRLIDPEQHILEPTTIVEVTADGFRYDGRVYGFQPFAERKHGALIKRAPEGRTIYLDEDFLLQLDRIPR